jgi:hypothetical protein
MFRNKECEITLFSAARGIKNDAMTERRPAASCQNQYRLFLEVDSRNIGLDERLPEG